MAFARRGRCVFRFLEFGVRVFVFPHDVRLGISVTSLGAKLPTSAPRFPKSWSCSIFYLITLIRLCQAKFRSCFYRVVLFQCSCIGANSRRLCFCGLHGSLGYSSVIFFRVGRNFAIRMRFPVAYEWLVEMFRTQAAPRPGLEIVKGHRRRNFFSLIRRGRRVQFDPGLVARCAARRA